jgi:hypothetical protein
MTDLQTNGHYHLYRKMWSLSMNRNRIKLSEDTMTIIYTKLKRDSGDPFLSLN